MMCLCLCRILRTNIEFYRSNSQIYEDQIFTFVSEMISEMKMAPSSSVKLEHPFWSLKIIGVSKEDASKSYKNLIIRSQQGYVLVRDQKNAINIVDNTDVSANVNLTDISDGLLSEVIVEDKLATIKKKGIISPSSLEEIQEISRIVSTQYITRFKQINLINLEIPSSADDDVKSLLSICSESTSVANLRGKFISHVRSKTLLISEQVLSDSETRELVLAMKDKVENVFLRHSVRLNTDSMAKYLQFLWSGSKCRRLFVPYQYEQEWRLRGIDVAKRNKNITILFITPQWAKQKAQWIAREAEDPGFEPSVSDIRETSGLIQTGYLTKLKYISFLNPELSKSSMDDLKLLCSICTELLTVGNTRCCKIFSDVRSRRLEIINQELSDSDTKELVISMRNRVENVVMRDTVTLNTDSMTRYLKLYLKGGSKCRSLFVPARYRNLVPVWREIVKNNQNLTITFLTLQQAMGEKFPGYKPFISDIRVSAELARKKYLTALKYLRLEDLDLSPSDEPDIKSLLSVCTDSVDIYNMRRCHLIFKHVNCKELRMTDQTLSASDTEDLVISLRDRVERVELFSGVRLDVKTVDRMIELLIQGTCRHIGCSDNTRFKYKQHLSRWAHTLGWKEEDEILQFYIYKE